MGGMKSDVVFDNTKGTHHHQYSWYKGGSISPRGPPASRTPPSVAITDPPLDGRSDIMSYRSDRALLRKILGDARGSLVGSSELSSSESGEMPFVLGVSGASIRQSCVPERCSISFSCLYIFCGSLEERKSGSEPGERIYQGLL